MCRNVGQREGLCLRFVRGWKDCGCLILTNAEMTERGRCDGFTALLGSCGHDYQGDEIPRERFDCYEIYLKILKYPSDFSTALRENDHHVSVTWSSKHFSLLG